MIRDTLREFVAGRLHKVREFGEHGLVGERRRDDQTYARYYFDCSPELPEPAALREYQDRWLGPDWFDAASSLRWNSYLVFVPSTSPPSLRKRAIEADRDYARKFVLTDDELKSFLADEPTSTGGARATLSAAQRWSEKLLAAGLASVVGTLPYSKTGDAIENGESEGGAGAEAPGALSHDAPAPERLRELDIRTFRPYPATRKFEFGLVNLLRGANGSGKTSLFEAIEYAYCGNNLRHAPDGPVEIFARFGTAGQSIRCHHRADQKAFRDSHQHWYGQTDPRTQPCKLVASFGRFNFLNTDALNLVTFSEQREDTEAALQNLILGSEASRLWTRIEKMKEELGKRLPRLERSLVALGAELDEHQKRLHADEHSEIAAGAIVATLDPLLAEWSWSRVDLTPVELARALQPVVSALGVALKAVQRLSWLGASSLAEVPSRRAALAERAERVNELVAAGARLEKEVRARTTALEAHRVALSRISRLQEYAASGMIGFIDELRGLRDTVKLATEELGTAQDITPETVAGLAGSEPLEQQAAKLDVEIPRLLAERSAAVTAASAAKLTRTRVEALRAEIRTRARELLELDASISECPVCATGLGHSGLEQRLALPEPTPSGDQHALLERQRRELDVAVETAQSRRSAIARLTAFVARVGDQQAPWTLDGAMEALRRVSARLTDSKARVRELTDRLEGLAANGYTASELAELRVGEAGVLDTSAPDREYDSRHRLADDEQREVTARKQELADLLRRAQELTNDGLMPASLRHLQDQLTTQDAAAREAWEAWTRASDGVDVPTQLSMAAVSARVGQLDHLCAELLGATKGRLAGDERATIESALDDVKRKHAETLARAERIRSALHVIDDILANDSRQHAAQAAVHEIRKEVERVFRKVHTPREFEGLGETFDSLRRMDGSLAALTQISTGQRSALALCIFLALNRQAGKAPPVILIDDPVAHVDDLNTLSFLDHLRDVVESQRKQVVFGTANSKLASLFEKKFDYLGDEFRRFELVRE